MASVPDTSLPPSFVDQMRGTYLGSPVVVEGILTTFVADIMEWVKQRSAGTMSASEMSALIYDRSRDFAVIFSGADDHYLPVVGWNSRIGGLQESLKVDLSHFWQSHRALMEDDPYRVLYQWLTWAIVDGLKNDDEDMRAASIGSRLQQLVHLLTGSTRRV